jgi:hypothetical protein
MSADKPLQQSGRDKVLGRGRGRVAAEQVLRARVLMRQWPAAERGSSTTQTACRSAKTSAHLPQSRNVLSRTCFDPLKTACKIRE